MDRDQIRLALQALIAASLVALNVQFFVAYQFKKAETPYNSSGMTADEFREALSKCTISPHYNGFGTPNAVAEAGQLDIQCDPR